MSNALLMHVIQGFDDISEVLYCLFEAEGVYLVKIVKESSSIEVLHHQVNILLVVKGAVELDDVGMVKARVKSDFLNELVYHLVLLYLLLLHFFNGTHETCLMVTNQINLSKFALSENCSQLKTIQHWRLLSVWRFYKVFLFEFGLQNFIEGLIILLVRLWGFIIFGEIILGLIGIFVKFGDILGWSFGDLRLACQIEALVHGLGGSLVVDEGMGGTALSKLLHPAVLSKNVGFLGGNLEIIAELHGGAGQEGSAFGLVLFLVEVVLGDWVEMGRVAQVGLRVVTAVVRVVELLDIIAGSSQLKFRQLMVGLGSPLGFFDDFYIGLNLVLGEVFDEIEMLFLHLQFFVGRFGAVEVLGLLLLVPFDVGLGVILDEGVGVTELALVAAHADNIFNNYYFIDHLHSRFKDRGSAASPRRPADHKTHSRVLPSCRHR